MANFDPRISLSSRWCFKRDELVITFPTQQLALDYQRANPEGRIFASLWENTNNDVYLPRPEGLKSLRSSTQSEFFSLVLEFNSESQARTWNDKVLFSTIYSDRSKTHAYINKKLLMPSTVSNNLM